MAKSSACSISSRRQQFNDHFGHDGGDALLREVGAVLRGALRQEDFAYRYGGEEFLLLLPGLDAEAAMVRAEEIRPPIAGLGLVHHGTPLGPVRASVGVASAPLHCRVDRLIETANAALLRAKDRGRNRVAMASTRKDQSAA